MVSFDTERITHLGICFNRPCYSKPFVLHQSYKKHFEERNHLLKKHFFRYGFITECGKLIVCFLTKKHFDICARSTQNKSIVNFCDVLWHKTK